MEKYIDREHAGKVLAELLSAYKNNANVLVLALPRGGVPVAFEIAKILHAPLDVFIVRKLGVPTHSELAMGAIASGDVVVYNEDIIRSFNLSKGEIESVISQEKQELKRREKVYQGDKPFPSLKDKTVILVDDGIATGATIRAAIIALRALHPAKLIVAVPVAEKTLCDKMASLADEFYCPLRPIDFYAVGAWYDNFSQTEDEEVHQLLNAAKSFVKKDQYHD